MLKGLIGRKIGMTQIFDEAGVALPVTLIEAGPCFVTQVRTPGKGRLRRRSSSDSAEIHSKRLTGGELGHLTANKIPPLRFLREFRTKSPDVNVGDKVTVEAFAVGEHVDVMGVSKGKGFAGVVKRHHFHGMDATHGTSDRNRAPGSNSSGTTPGRVYRGSRRAGHMGTERVTAQNLKVVLVDADAQPDRSEWLGPRRQGQPRDLERDAQAVGAEEAGTITMKVDVLNMQGEKVKQVDLPAAIFEAKVNHGPDASGLPAPDGQCPPGYPRDQGAR